MYFWKWNYFNFSLKYSNIGYGPFSNVKNCIMRRIITKAQRHNLDQELEIPASRWTSDSISIVALNLFIYLLFMVYPITQCAYLFRTMQDGNRDPKEAASKQRRMANTRWKSVCDFGIGSELSYIKNCKIF